MRGICRDDGVGRGAGSGDRDRVLRGMCAVHVTSVHSVAFLDTRPPRGRGRPRPRPTPLPHRAIARRTPT
eukprot:3953098-Prymnesium_polylepis.1